MSVTPEFWLGAVWRATMGREVLAVGGDRSGTVRLYAHRNASSGRVTAAIINLGTAPATVDVALVGGNGSTGHGHGIGLDAGAGYALYQLTAYPPSAGLEAGGVALNGEPLALGAGGAVPPFTPRRVQPGAGTAVVAPPHSVSFCAWGP